MSLLTVKVVVNPQWTRLHAELAPLPERARAERLRHLASAWLEFSDAGRASAVPDGARSPPPPSPPREDEISGAVIKPGMRAAMDAFASSME